MRKLTQNNYIERCIKIHDNKFDYSKTKYINIRSKIIVICKKHGEFEISADNHLLQKQGCLKCAQEKHKLIELSIDRIENLKKIHNNKYFYKNKLVKSGFIIITCPIHGDFEQYLYFHEYGHGCPECNSSSRGEYRIKSYLNKNKIIYKRNYEFDDCIKIKKMKFDFYLPDYNLCIEYDGEHHYIENKYFGDGNLNYIKENDNIKNKYCEDNNIKIIRIPYWNFNHIDDILDQINL